MPEGPGGSGAPGKAKSTTAWSWPALTAGIPRVELIPPRHPEDFRVHELPATTPSGAGEHVWFEIEKRGLDTRQAVRRIASCLGVEARDVGAAGRKDARALTRQWLSVRGVDPAQVSAVDLPGIEVRSVHRHERKLRTGHLSGNRFVLRLRGIEPDRLRDVETVVRRIEESGLPNYFGPQRFGVRGDTWEVGRALLSGDFARAARLVAGSPRGFELAGIARARGLFDAGEYRAAARAWPRRYPEGAILSREMARHGDPERALARLDRRLLRFYVSSFQAWLFNHVVAARVAELDRLLPGDLAWKHDSGAVFPVEDPAPAEARLRRFEVSPSGPLHGPRMTAPRGRPLEIEEGILLAQGVERESFRHPAPWRCRGARRPLRVPLSEARLEEGRDAGGAFLELSFVLPAGSYATVLLAEVGGAGEGRGISPRDVGTVFPPEDFRE